MRKIKIVNIESEHKTRVYINETDISDFVSELEIIKLPGKKPLVKLYLIGLVEIESNDENQVMFDTLRENV